MPRRSAVEQLPTEVREDLERELIKHNFADYEALAEWMQGLGYEISKSSLHRHGQKFEARLKALKIATEQAKAITAETRDEGGELNDALISLVQSKTFEILMALQEAEDMDVAKLGKIGHMVADLGRASVQQKKLLQQASDRARKQALEEAAERVSDAAQQQGLNEDQAQFWREQVLGI